MQVLAQECAQQAEVFRKVGRNEPCPCGSGLKFKKCHGLSGSGDPDNLDPKPVGRSESLVGAKPMGTNDAGEGLDGLYQ